MSQSTINFQIPVAFMTEDAKTVAAKFGKIYVGAEYAEVLCNGMRFTVKEFESYLEQNEIPYILQQSGTYLNPPKVKKCIPTTGYTQEFECYTHTGDEDGDEDGIVKVSELKSLIAKNPENLAAAIQSLIAQRTFTVNEII